MGHLPRLGAVIELGKFVATSWTKGIVAAARPALAVVSAGRDSPYGHPHAEVPTRWRDAGAQVLTTGERGMITVSTDGEDLSVETFVRRWCKASL